ncbi:TPA: hypothetical protein MFB66_005189 [Klebsiella pneumoniae]|jgi:hypothetical protein|uniref:Uncharacterized protein n=3 Tax=Enterobacteriaceae TaxID=543 RepID=A0ABD7AT54_9ENTR|nr:MULTISPECIES: hypothetical protein [Enterobacterales]MDF8318059.1 hypothetical protein [Serratia nevei]HBQ3761278.1 hypothetical protein [Klebsiella quasipneumoniae subsp. similipneumoniae]HCM4298634.1 hypothetical protein [Klebsiella quasipneumoniae subsp. quasipneumoniae]HDS7618284.1 hypothetical protein [Klebsiella pneumoniae subsp. ozaenae]HEJ8533405.1 hypothetical protein [Klebsiella oxytoca]
MNNEVTIDVDNEVLKTKIIDFLNSQQPLDKPVLLAKVGSHLRRTLSEKLPITFKLKNFIHENLKGKVDIIESTLDKTYCAVKISNYELALDKDQEIVDKNTRTQETLFDFLLRNLSQHEMKYVSIPLNILNKKVN